MAWCPLLGHLLISRQYIVCFFSFSHILLVSVCLICLHTTNHIESLTWWRLMHNASYGRLIWCSAFLNDTRLYDSCWIILFLLRWRWMLFVALSGWLMMWWLMNNAARIVFPWMRKTIIYLRDRCCVSNFWARPIVCRLLSPTAVCDRLINNLATRVGLYTMLLRYLLLPCWRFILRWTSFGWLACTVLNWLRFRLKSWFRSSYVVGCVFDVINVLFKSIGYFIRVFPLVTWRVVIGTLMILLLIQISILAFLTLGSTCVVVMACWCCFW